MSTSRIGGIANQGTVLPRSVRRALDLMCAEPGRVLTLGELAAIAGVSPRTLQRQFRTFLGETPQAALRAIRLERARRDLLRASRMTTVADVALRCGFLHLGRFSVEYRGRYGEKPSQTLRRRTTFLAERSTKPSSAAFGRDRPTIAVIPNAQGADEALATSVVDELATALMRAGVAITHKSGTARYHLRCTLRAAGNETRLISRLIDAATGRHLWAHCHDGTSDGTLQFEENAAAVVAVAMQPCLRAAEAEHARQKPDADQTAHDLTMRALPYALALDIEGNKRSLDLLDRAIELDPDHTLAIALAAWCHAQGVAYHFSHNPDQARARALMLARRATSIGGDPSALPILGNAFALAGDVRPLMR
jgi:AraC-like DNA-binding protein